MIQPLVLHTPLHACGRRGLLRVWTRIVTVEEIDSNDTTNLELLERPELGITFSKIAVWSLTDYGR